jgi:hypothetical protein
MHDLSNKIKTKSSDIDDDDLFRKLVYFFFLIQNEIRAIMAIYFSLLLSMCVKFFSQAFF